MTVLATILTIVVIVAAMANIVTYLFNVAEAMAYGMADRTVTNDSNVVYTLKKAYSAQ